jgi:tetratricopeptide (TPR) repeat protein
MKKSGMNLTALLLGMAILAGSPGNNVFAAGEGGGGSGGSGSTSSTMPPPKCKAGEVWDPEAKRFFGKGKCVAESEMQEGSGDRQGLIYDYGRTLAYAGEYSHAIDVLAMAPDQKDPRVLNMLGYSNRKLGRMNDALAYYHAAIAENPDFSLVREYLGEAYIELGMLEQARGQLSEIERICGGKNCSEYGQLANLIISSQID